MKKRMFVKRRNAFPGRPRRKAIILFTLAFTMLLGIFLISFFVSHNRITSERRNSGELEDLDIIEDEELTETEILLSEKDEEIEVLKMQIEEYRETIALLQEKERKDAGQIQSLQREVNQLRSKIKNSNVQKDVYGN